jgi:putative transposase
MIVGWQASRSLRSDLAIDALEMAVHNRQRQGADLTALVHHSNRGVQHLSVRYSQRLADNSIVASVGSKGDSYDCEMLAGSSGRGLTLAYDWPECLGVDLSAPVGRRSTQRRLAGRAVTE